MEKKQAAGKGWLLLVSRLHMAGILAAVFSSLW
jgi:hypothetical protein